VPESSRQYLLKVNSSALTHYAVHPKNISCCYSVTTRVNGPAEKEYNLAADNYYSVRFCSNFETEVLRSPDEELILVRCFEATKSGTKREVYKNTHAVVPVKRTVELKLNKTSSQRRSADKERLSILMLGFDSVSSLNLIRSLPRTVHHLRRNGWLELRGYNKMGENTLPNIAALLMRLCQDEVKKQCWVSRFKNFDSCPFIWWEFSKLGYVTAYAELHVQLPQDWLHITPNRLLYSPAFTCFRGPAG
jgi:hypothetical protein